MLATRRMLLGEIGMGSRLSGAREVWREQRAFDTEHKLLSAHFERLDAQKLWRLEHQDGLHVFWISQISQSAVLLTTQALRGLLTRIMSNLSRQELAFALHSSCGISITKQNKAKHRKLWRELEQATLHDDIYFSFFRATALLFSDSTSARQCFSIVMFNTRLFLTSHHATNPINCARFFFCAYFFGCSLCRATSR